MKMDRLNLKPFGHQCDCEGWNNSEGWNYYILEKKLNLKKSLKPEKKNFEL